MAGIFDRDGHTVVLFVAETTHPRFAKKAAQVWPSGLLVRIAPPLLMIDCQ